ncbi:flippase [Dyadobacter chenwenxiniae]|uniref:Flippase n=1 Tax=Dyadobacter chenwenxiniae TaxID=2906456 RepID=A0A9X1PMJ6_9BACT|nr:flippase [Dyadobacter chenwenxiniae]MCF0062714.1 flippase [Dyadobacter chenwenxiniae]UON83541.1 flippase [Dyadobacter chenwenxiniae]
MSKKGLFQNIISLGVVQVTNYALPLITVPVISRILGPDKFGVISYAASFMAYFTLLIGYGFDLTATRKISKDPANTSLRNQVFNEVFACKLLLFLISTFIFIICLFSFPPLALEKKVAVFSFIACIGTVFTQNWLFQAMQDLPKIAWLSLISKLLFTFTILIVVQQREDYVWQPLVTSLIQIVVAVSSYIWAVRKYNLRFHKVGLGEIFNLLWEEKVVFFSLMVISLYTTSNIIILGLFQSETQVGYYSAAQKLMEVARSVITLPLAMALYPYIGKAFGEGKDVGLRTVHRILPVIVLFTAISGVAMLLTGPMVLKMFYGNKFEPSIPVFQLLTFIPLIIALSNVFGIQIMMNLKMDKQFFRITASCAIISVILNVFMVQKIGYIGTAINWLVTEIVITISMYIVLRRNGINPIDARQFAPSAIYSQLQPVILKLSKRYEKK